MAPPPALPPDSYWNEFDVSDKDVESIYNLLLDREVPLTTAEMADAIVRSRLERFGREASEAPDLQAQAYLPGGEYQVGQTLVFPALGNLQGKVIGIRPGENPDFGVFDVIQVEFKDDGRPREFAARLAEHRLNQVPPPETEGEPLESAEEILARHGRLIDERLAAKLSEMKDIVRIAGRWFPRSLLVEIHVGHLNLSEAVLDVAEGGPLPTSALLEPLELPPGSDPLLMAFSLDYALQEDTRFDEVGPAGEVLWYLRRLEPPEVLFPPPRLDYTPVAHDRSLLRESLLSLERELDDEHSPLEPLADAVEGVTLSLLFPHWRVGALPLSSRLRPLFPTAYESPRIRFMLVDGHSGERFPGWVVRNERYVYGMENWYRKYQIPAGGLVRVRRGEARGEVIVEAVDRRRRNDWIRTVTLSEGPRIGFTMLKQPIATSYDDRMIIGILDPVALDEAWLRGEQRKLPIDRLVTQVFRELAKLNPQSAVHAQALYSAVNVVRRLPPAVIFAELVTQPHYLHVGDLYWRFDESLWTPP